MPSYRFCRPDDVPLLVKAVNECYDVHFPDREQYTVENFKEEMSTISLWPSSCMVVQEGEQPIAVLIGCKHEDETLIYKIGVHPEELRRGHASHMLQSLSSKLSVLGPPRIRTEIQSNDLVSEELFLANGFKEVMNLSDYLISDNNIEEIYPDCVGELRIDDLTANNLFFDKDQAWLRKPETIIASKEHLQAIAIATAETVEAVLVFSQIQDEAVVYHFNAQSQQARELMFIVLAKFIPNKQFILPKLSLTEIPECALDKLSANRLNSYKILETQAANAS